METDKLEYSKTPEEERRELNSLLQMVGGKEKN
jgi:hypothetical protein